MAQETFPNRRAAALRNRIKILAAAKDAFIGDGTDASMAEVARRAGVGMATLYRNFPGRQDLLEAVYADEVDALCAAASPGEGRTAGENLLAWLRELFAFLPGKHLLVSALRETVDSDSAALGGNRERALGAGRPLLEAAQQSGEIRDDLTIEQLFDLTIAVAAIPGDDAYRAPVLETMLRGLSRHTTRR